MERALTLIALSAFLVVASSSLANQLYLIRPDGTGLRAITDSEKRGYGSPDWAPDGKRIAFDTWPEGGGFETAQVAVMEIPDEGAFGEVTLLGHGAMPSWSPDGTQFVCHTYADNNQGDTPQIVIVNADGSGREAILDQWGSPRWNPDGKHIVSLYRGGLAAYDLETGRQQMLLEGINLNFGFSISPDGSRYAFGAMSGGFGIASDDPILGGLKAVFHALAPTVRHTSWSPDGKQIVAMSTEQEFGRLFLFTTDMNGPIESVPGIPEDWHCFDPDWSPDGDWIVFSAQTSADRKIEASSDP